MTPLLLFRHGLAEGFRPGQADRDRSLSPEGWVRTREAMIGLAGSSFLRTHLGLRSSGLVGVSSPYRRAVETLDCLREAMGGRADRSLSTPGTSWGGFPFLSESWPGLVPHADTALAEAWLRGRIGDLEEGWGLALVSHEPFCSTFLVRLTGQQRAFAQASCAFLQWKAGRFCLVDFLGAEEMEALS